MSLYTPRPSSACQEQLLFANKHDNASEAHMHDRQEAAKGLSGRMAGPGGGVAAADISAVQKMISATWGSILTSLLGIKAQSPCIYYHACA
jgi:hypothetical protein